MLIGAIIEKQSGYYWYTGRGGSTGAAGNLYICNDESAARLVQHFTRRRRSQLQREIRLPAR